MWGVPEISLIMMRRWTCVWHSSPISDPGRISVYSCLSRDMSPEALLPASQKADSVSLNGRLLRKITQNWPNRAQTCKRVIVDLFELRYSYLLLCHWGKNKPISSLTKFYIHEILLSLPKQKTKMKTMRALYVGDDHSFMGKIWLSNLQRASLIVRFYDNVRCSRT
jgi:hypothetical protein